MGIRISSLPSYTNLQDQDFFVIVNTQSNRTQKILASVVSDAFALLSTNTAIGT